MLLIEIFVVFWKILSVVFEMDYAEGEVLLQDCDGVYGRVEAVYYVVVGFWGVFYEGVWVGGQLWVWVGEVVGQGWCCGLVLLLEWPIDKYQVRV